MKHVILGAGGAISKVLAEELIKEKQDIKLISRSRKTIIGIETLPVNLLDFEELKKNIDKFSIVYLVAGLDYKTSVWQKQWPEIMRNTVNACKDKEAKLIFFDNVYSYGKVEGVMTEDIPLNPSSKKGEIRAELIEYLNSEIKNKNINALIARSADFYGPYSESTSVFNILVLMRMIKGKKAQWFVNAIAKHSFTYTGDCGKALYLLSKSGSAFSQTWHLPTAGPAKTGEELIKIAAGILDTKTDYSVLPKWMFKIGGIFNSIIKESYEMLYQFKYEYIFDSSKFEKKFNFFPTPYEKGIEETIEYLKKKVI